MTDALLQGWPYLVAAYLIGSIPTGVLFGRLAGRDPREEGSGNIGASNVARVLGKKWGAATLIVDVAKGAMPVYLTQHYAAPDVALAAGGLAVLGHCYPIWLKFAGGKGVATAFGVMLPVLPVIAMIAAMTWITVIYFTRTPAIGSLAAAALFVALPQLNHHPIGVHLFTLTIAIVILIRHTSNLRTLKSRYTEKKKKKGRGRR